MIRNRAVSPVEVMEAVLAQVAAQEPRINAFAQLLAKQAMEGARLAEAAVISGRALGPLHGAPATIKDVVPMRGLPMRGGSHIHAGTVAEEDALAVGRRHDDLSVVQASALFEKVRPWADRRPPMVAA
jgi:aspartyl-tRNA(Asn)/glutamyl-tRNA(Gln) amidotransferase subunit A